VVQGRVQWSALILAVLGRPGTCRAPSGTRCTVRIYADCAEEAKQTPEVDF
jgi:hypothetical protein